MTLPRTLLASSLTAALALAACVDDNADSGLTILHIVKPEDGCVFGVATGSYLPAGVIQVDSPQGYVMAPEVRNDLALADGEAATPKTVFLTGAKVDLSFYDETLFTAAEQAEMQTSGETRYQIPLSGSVDPNHGLNVLPFEVLSLSFIRAVGARLPAPTEADPLPKTVVNVQFRMTGVRGGSSLESNVFNYPITICSNCVRHFVGACADLNQTFVAAPGGACGPLQDGALDCCDDNGTLVCPAERPTQQ